MSLSFEATNKLAALENAEMRLVGLFEDGKAAATAAKIDQRQREVFESLFAQGEIKASAGATLVVQSMPATAGRKSARQATAQAWLLVNLGKPDGKGNARRIQAETWRKVLTSIGSAIKQHGYQSVGLDILTLRPRSRDLASAAAELVEVIGGTEYQFLLHPRASKPTLYKRHVVLHGGKLGDVKQGIAHGNALISGMNTARDLGNLAPNRCTPQYLADHAASICQGNERMSLEVLDEDDMEALGMGAFLAVSRGSDQPGRMIAMKWHGKPGSKDSHVLVGKGVTFDSGGISIKPSAAMDEMKFDMCGAASVFGVMRALTELELPINVVGVVAAAENMLDGKSTRPGDVVQSMSGQSIEILNTDAEGRLVLADALTWVKKFKPIDVIDIATLTGSCVVALGGVASGLMGNDDTLLAALKESAEQSGDRVWPLPLWDDYDQQLASRFADMANIGGRMADAVIAGCFLKRFAGDYQWAHLDIAGTAWLEGKDKGATGRPVPLLLNYLQSKATSQNA